MPPRRPKTAPAARIDDWASTTSALGGAKDKHTGLTFEMRPRLGPTVIEALVSQHPIAARIVDKIVDSAFSVPWKICKVVGPDSDKFDAAACKADLDKAGLTAAEKQSAHWSRLYGGAITAIAVLNTGEPDQPMTFGSQSRLLRFAAVPAERARPLDQDAGFLSPTYGVVLKYQCTGIASAPCDLHYTRAIPHEPIKLPLEAQTRSGSSATGWGPSILDRVFDDLGRYGATGAFATSMMYVASLFYMQLDGYRADAQTKDGQARIQKRAEQTRKSLDAFGLLVMDKADMIGILERNLTGAGDLMTKTADRLAAATEYPREVLFNESPAGLNAGELSGPQELYFATVGSWRKNEVNPGLRRGVEIWIRLKGLDIDSFEIEWEPLWSRSDEGDSEIHARNATADHTYIDDGVLTADEVRVERFVRGNVGMLEIKGEASDPADPLELDPADVAAGEAAAGAVPADATSVQDQALNGSQWASLSNTVKEYNSGLMSWNQARGILALAIPGRDVTGALGAPPPDPDLVVSAAVASTGPAASTDEMPNDRVTVQAAAQRFGVKTRTITRMIDLGLPFWGLGAHKVVSIAAVEKMAKAHEEIVEAEDPADPNDQDPPADAPVPGAGA
jgi:phage-related protein (TIGR01555 family)